METKTQAITRFLSKQTTKVDLYSPRMEVQVNVLPGPDKVKTGKSFQWTDGKESWNAFRIPHKGRGIQAEPTYNDSILDWDFDKHVEAIGLTGWDWASRLSHWVGFDFDSIANHERGLTDYELDELRDRISGIDWVTLRRSTSGKGYHLYVSFAEPVSTANHTEHAALARSILSHLSGILNFPFSDKVDACGGILWIWHRKANADSSSFKLLKRGVPLAQIPPNWKDFLQERRSPRGTDPEKFKTLLDKTKTAELDDDHRQIINYLVSQEYLAWWDSELGILVTHTFALKQAHKALDLKGIFDTIATGKDLPNDHNCFCFPLNRGGWRVFRYGQETREHEYWGQSPNGWRFCELNVIPSLDTASRAHSGLRTRKGRYRFKTLLEAYKVLKLMGISLDIPPSLRDRETTIYPGDKENEIVISVVRVDEDPSMSDWYQERGPGGRGKAWERVVIAESETKIEEIPDDILRYVTLPDGNGSWFVKSAAGIWKPAAKSDAKDVLVVKGYEPKETSRTFGAAVVNDWEEVSLPFQTEYPGNRRWNRKSAQLAVPPKPGDCPHWDILLDHIGRNLTDDVLDNDWCLANDILTGTSYLTHYLACLFQYPFEPLPYLFLYSKEQNTGKSILHEAIELCFRDGVGYCLAGQALKSEQGFNAELYGAVVCVIEEINVGGNSLYLDRIKDWVTGRNVLIHPKRGTPFRTKNTWHWIHVANDPSYAPIFPGDTRIVVANVKPFEGAEIPKPIFIERLRSELPFFLHKLRTLIIPESSSRLRIPVLNSGTKADIEALNRNEVDAFIEDHIQYTEGAVLSAETFLTAFYETVEPIKAPEWSREKVLKSIPIGPYPRGRYGGGGALHFGNMSLRGVEPRIIGTGKVKKVNNKLAVP